ncbi:MAG: hypothetical protein JWM19_4850 [Actinomycetia bacterium]|nr:hypothetical protein [Actinomycetes bacterium]
MPLLAAGPCVLAGHSWGGVLVQLLAFRQPDLAATRQAGEGSPAQSQAILRW